MTNHSTKTTEFESITDDEIDQMDVGETIRPLVKVDLNALDLTNATPILQTSCKPRLDLKLLTDYVDCFEQGLTPADIFKRGSQLREYTIADFVLTYGLVMTGEIQESALSKYKAPVEQVDIEPIDESWWHALEKRGDWPHASASNCHQAIATCPALLGIIGYDKFSHEVVKLREIDGPSIAPVVWTEQDTTRVWYYLEKTVYMKDLPLKFVEKALGLIKHEHQIDTLEMHIEALPPHDGVARIDSWLIDYASAENTKMHRVSGRKFLIGMMERALYPGIDCKRSLILFGKQNVGKSSLCKIIVGNHDWFDNRLRNISNEVTTGNQLRGKWLIEIAEGVGIGRSEREEIKNFMSTNVDKFTPKYSNDETRIPRRIAMILTTNDMEILSDPSGHSRWMPVEVGQVDFDGLREVRDQLLAEALEAVIAGENSQLSPEDAILMEAWCDQYTVEDPLETLVRRVLVHTEHKISLADLCEQVGVMFTSAGAPTRRVKDVLLKLNWIHKTTNGYRFYARSDESLPEYTPLPKPTSNTSRQVQVMRNNNHLRVVGKK